MIRHIFSRKRHEEFLITTYKELLLREPDEAGLEHYLTCLRDGSMKPEDVRDDILKSEEGQRIISFSHYTDKYWNDLDMVKKYKNELATGDPNKEWIDDIVSKFQDYLPFKKVLIVGCGNGWLERRLFDLGIGLHFDAFDLSEEYIQTAIKEKGNRPITYFVSDINKMENIADRKYDAVFNYAILHHAKNIEYVLLKLSKVLKPNGLIFNEEYVGPSHNQYSKNHLDAMYEVVSRLPEELRPRHSLKPNIENFRVEPSEAIHSDLIQFLFTKYFEIMYERNLNGGIAYQILWNNIDGFKDQTNEEVKNSLIMLLNEDRKLSESKKVPVLFWFSVGKPKEIGNLAKIK